MAQKKTYPGKMFAIKKISLEFSDPSEYRYIEREIRIMLALDHPNIIKIVEIFKDNRNIYLVMELCQGNDI
jgi:serine/threonine protein kinase